MGKSVTIKIYQLDDLDLYSFIVTHEFDVKKAIYCSLKALSRGEAFVTTLPPLKPAKIIHKKTIMKRLVLDEKKDKAIIDLLEKIAPGYRNCFIKNVLRLYLAAPFTEEFFLNPDDYSEMMDKLQGIRQGRRTTRAADLRKKKINHARKNNNQEQKKKEPSILNNPDEKIDSSPKETADFKPLPNDESVHNMPKIEKTDGSDGNESFSDITNILFQMIGQ